MKTFKKVLLSIKVNGETFHPQEPGIQHPLRSKGHFLPVCIIRKLPFGFWLIDYHDESFGAHRRFKYSTIEEENFPNTRIIASPFFVEFVKYGLTEIEQD